MSFTSSTDAAPPRRAPERSRAQTRERLLRAATELFARQGLRRTTTVQIAHEAGVAAGTFYLHFPDKGALFREIVFDTLADLRERLRRAAATAHHDPRERVRARAREMFDFAEENGNLVRILFGRDHEMADLGDDVLEALVPEFEAGLRKHIAAGRLDPALHPAAAARALAVLWPSLVAWWLEDPSRASREAVIETLVQLHPVASTAA